MLDAYSLNLEQIFTLFTFTFHRQISVQLNTQDSSGQTISTINWLQNRTYGELATLELSSDPQIVSDYVAGLVTVLNQVIFDFVSTLLPLLRNFSILKSWCVRSVDKMFTLYMHMGWIGKYVLSLYFWAPLCIGEHHHHHKPVLWTLHSTFGTGF